MFCAAAPLSDIPHMTVPWSGAAYWVSPDDSVVATAGAAVGIGADAGVEVVVEPFAAQLVRGSNADSATATAHRRRAIGGRKRGGAQWTGIIRQRGEARTTCDTA